MNPKTIRHLACAFAIPLLAGCHGATSIRTQTVNGRFVFATAHRIQVDVQTPGSLNNTLVMPLDPQAKITVAGRTQTVDQIPHNDKVKVTRNIDTHRVIRIEAD